MSHGAAVGALSTVGTQLVTRIVGHRSRDRDPHRDDGQGPPIPSSFERLRAAGHCQKADWRGCPTGVIVCRHGEQRLPVLDDRRGDGQAPAQDQGGDYAMVARGQLPGVVRLGRRVFIRRDDLFAWIDQNRVPSPEASRG